MPKNESTVTITGQGCITVLLFLIFIAVLVRVLVWVVEPIF